MTATVFSEVVHPCAPVVSEEPGWRSRDAATIATNQTIVVGQVLGKLGVVASETASVVYAAGDVGDGALTMDGTAPIRSDAIDGVYTVEFTGTGATALFNVLDPKGLIVGEGNVGTTFAGPIKFAIADDASHHYAIGDRILVTIARPVGDDQYKAWSPSATDGSQTACAIALYPLTTTSATAKITAITRAAEIRASDLTWASGATTAQINEATNQLLAAGIVLR